MSSRDLTIDLQFLPSWAKESATNFSPVEIIAEGSKDQNRATGRSEREFRKNARKRRVESSARSTKGAGRGRRKDRREKRAERGESSASVECPLEFAFIPEPKALESVIDQVKTTARAYPLLLIARMFLDKPERHHVRISFKKMERSNDPRSMFKCALCGDVALDESAMIKHVLRKHRDRFYKAERVQGEAPKGNYTSVARCGLNGAILGPTNHHAYMATMMQLYREKFGHMALGRFKESIRSVHDPEAVKKWMEQASWKTSWICLEASEPKILASDVEMERHFRENHFSSTTKSFTTEELSGDAARQLEDPIVASGLRRAWLEESRFPMPLANRLREAFFKAGLYVFKGARGIQYVGPSKPIGLAYDASQVSETIRRILDFVSTNPHTDRKTLLKALDDATSMTAETASPYLQDFHWLVKQGNMIEYHDGRLEVTRVKTPPLTKVPLHRGAAGRPAALGEVATGSVSIES